MRILSYVFILAAGNSLLFSSSALAQTSSNDVSEDQSIEEVLTVHPLAERGTSQALTVLTGDELAREVTDSLGETIAGEPGIRSSGFGTAVGRPVIHGLGQARVKTTQDRIDTLDVSVTSPDHAVSVEPYVANSITILKGAATLLYGAGAIGGVVDVDTGRVPTVVPDKAVTGRAEARFGDNGDASTGAFRLDGKFSDNVVFHVDGYTKEADEFEVPDDPDVMLNSNGDLFGSFRESEGGAVGISWIGETGLIGVSVSQIDGFYGLLSGEEEEEEGEEAEEAAEEVAEVVEGLLEELQSGVIDLEQTRFDFDARLNQPFAGVKELSARFGVNDYEHAEIESSGEVGTVFDNDAWEARVELKHEAIAGFEGTLGLQLGDREFSAVGAEAFIAPTETDSIALFWVGERQFNGFDLEAGVRFEEVDHQPVDSSQPPLDFSTVSASIGAVVPLSEQTRISGLIDLSSRAPMIEELYSNGPHLATQTFEIGDLTLEEEDAASISVSINHRSDILDINATLYHNEFDGFIYQENIGEIEDGLPVLVYTQDDASFTGLDFEAVLHAYRANDSHLDLGFIYDIVSASLSSSSGVDNRDLPRIPADRAGVYANWFSNAWNLKVEYSRISSQNDTAAFELPTDSYDDLGFSLGRSFQFSDNELTLYLRGRNLTDDVQRNHTSFVKDFVPAPGRTVEVGLQFAF